MLHSPGSNSSVCSSLPVLRQRNSSSSFAVHDLKRLNVT